MIDKSKRGGKHLLFINFVMSETISLPNLIHLQQSYSNIQLGLIQAYGANADTAKYEAGAIISINSS